MHKVGTTNLVASATVTPSTEDSVYVGDNIKLASRPFLPWRTTVITASNIVVDFGSAKQVRLLFLNRTNFTTVTIQGHASDSWGAPSFSQTYPITLNPFTGRYQLGVVLTTFNYRYLRILIPSQTPVDDASYFLLGGLWASDDVIDTPFAYEADNVEYEVVEPRLDVSPESQAVRQRLKLGEPYLRLNVQRKSTVDPDNPVIGNGPGDMLSRWLRLDRETRCSPFVFFTQLGDPSQVYVVRRVAMPRWSMQDLSLARDAWTLEETVGP